MDYLGDSVYASWDGYAVKLTTQNGLPTDPSNTIVLEPAVLRRLFNFAYIKGVRLENSNG